MLDYLRLRGEPATLAQIGEAIGMSETSASRIAAALVASGAIVRAGKVKTTPRGTRSRLAVLWTAPELRMRVACEHGEQAMTVMAWTARQAVATTDLPHRAISQAGAGR
ncbi:MAG: helix-turn-helix domain-containing protein [Rhodanobacteraceae bacterium]|nr:helix-turn-helix domain-containing protein [Rhodanobacteraceae bacterium]